MPFIYIVISCMALVYIFPEIALWLPDYLYGNEPMTPEALNELEGAPPPAAEEIKPEGDFFDAPVEGEND